MIMNQKCNYNSFRPKGRGFFLKMGLLSIMVCLCTQSALANLEASLTSTERGTVAQSTVTGTILDDTGAPLPGASVVVKGTTNGTQTDFDGNFSIDALSDATLLISYIGFSSQEVAVNGQTTINVTLSEDAAALDEVIVTGYSTQTRGSLTGSVASVDLSEANKQPLVNVAEALQGRAAGVTVVNSGTPGSAPIVRIRGFGTVNNNNPLYIIDGVQTIDPNVLNTINPDDIAQFNVLKDGAAAIYGARASNGVIIITTKSGSYNQNKAVISVNAYTGFSQVDNSQLPDLLNAQELGNVIFESLSNDGITPSHAQYGDGATAVVPSQLNVGGEVIDGVPVTATVNPNGTNWLDEIFESALTQSFSLSASNGSENSKYAFSTSFLNRQGVQLNNRFLRGQMRLNSEFKLGKSLTIGNHLNASFDTSTRNTNVEDAFRLSPLVPVFDDQGRFAGGYNNNLGLSNAQNPVALLERGSNNYNRTTRILGDVYASLQLADGLSVKTVFAGDISIANNFTFIGRNPEAAEPAGNTLTQFAGRNYNWTWTNTLNYVKNFGKHTVNALAGVEAVSNEGDGFTTSNTDFLFENREFLVLTNGRGGEDIADAFQFENTLSSVFGSVNYSYDDRYLLSGTLRRDQSSRFIGDNQSQTFPSISAGWVISNEDFFGDNNIVSSLKFKASYGELGNQELPIANPTLNLFGFNADFANFPINGSNIAQGVILTQNGNPDLRWETSENINFGLDFGLFDNKLSFGIEYYNNTTRDLLTRGVAEDTGSDVDAAFINFGDVRNKGFDFSLSYQNQTNSGFSYGIDANVSTIDNEVLFLAEGTRIPGVNIPFANVAGTFTQEGLPISTFFGKETDGLDADGRINFVDQNGDGVINVEDDVAIGNPIPDVTAGLNLNAGFKGWDISAFFAGTFGNDIFNTSKIFTDLGQFPNGNRSTRVLDAFNPVTNPNGSQPALSFAIQNQENLPSEFFVESGSFVKLRNLQIGYSLPSATTDRLGLSKLRFYVSGTNLFTFTGYSGIDPEIQPLSGSTSANTLGVDRNTAPISQQFLVGINLSL